MINKWKSKTEDQILILRQINFFITDYSVGLYIPVAVKQSSLILIFIGVMRKIFQITGYGISCHTFGPEKEMVDLPF